MSTKAERDEWRRLAGAASPERPDERIEVWRSGARSGAMREEDGAFYVAARTAVPALLDEVRAAQEETELLHAALHRHHEEIARLRSWERDARAALEDAAAWADHAGTCLIEMRRARGRPAAESDCDCYRAALRAILERKP